MKKIYFQGLNEVRAIAALSVFVYHVECNKRIRQIPNMFNTSLKDSFNILGASGVHVFFVLSGFLITYLLLREKETFQKIDLKKFFARRMLRIWPLYYVIILFSFLVIPPAIESFRFLQTSPYFNGILEAFWEHPYKLFLLYMVFLPNLD